MNVIEIPEDKDGKVIAEFMNWYLDKHPEEMERIYRGIIDKLIERDCYTPEPFVQNYGLGLTYLQMPDEVKYVENETNDG